MELQENSPNPPNHINLKIDSIIEMALRKKIPWTTLDIMLNEMTPTLETAKQVIKVLLHTLKSEVETNDSKSRIEIKEDQETQCDLTSLSMKMQKQEDNFQCEVCGKSFSKIGYLKKHEKIHNLRKTLMCKTCNKCFNTSWELKVHERNHSGERPHQCKICSKTFTQMYILKSHEKMHSSIKKFKCETCSKTFITKTNLIRHENSH